MYSQVITAIIIAFISRTYSLSFNKYIKRTKNNNDQNIWVPINEDEKKGFKEYIQTRQVKEQANNYYSKIRNEETLESYINRPYKYKSDK